jgi:tetratricopeptide (TPR) repeat protein
LYKRKVNIGERQLFEEGLKFEAEGEHDEAILRYIRAGKTSKEPHLSRLFIAAAYFRMNKFMVSLQHYTTAMKIISNVKGALYPQHDDFIAHYNR